MVARIEMRGSKELQAALRAAPLDIRIAASKAVIGTALEMQRDVKKSIQSGPATGVVYQKYIPRRTHRASAPGQAPASDTGRLASSIYFDKLGDLTATVGSRLKYAFYLEYGTSRISPRPFFRPAVERMRAKFIKRLERAILGAVK